VDNFYGSSRGYVQAVLGQEVIDELTQAQAIEFWHTEDNITFGGKKPEPSEANQRPLIDALKKSGRKLTLGVFMDPDADRIRFCDDTLDISMNLFGPIAFASLLNQGLAGGIATTVSSSDFGCEIARRNNRPVFETPVGFKFFREPLTKNEALVAFEESDGISFAHHTLEKDALGGFVCAINAMMTTNKSLSEQYDDLQKQYGYFYPDRAGLDVEGISLPEWDAHRKKLLPALTGGLFKEGDVMTLGSEQKTIARVNTLDGLKIIFDDLSWILLRPSGTEPKFRIYAEVVNKKPIKTSCQTSLLKSYRDAGAEILERAKKMIV
jgi:phosphomannomutase